jgi:hypothetical protein
VFAEVAVDRYTHMPQVRRIVATYDIGTLMNNKTGLNQLTGGIVWGVSFALHEEAHIDPVHGRTVNNNLAEYHVPVNRDWGRAALGRSALRARPPRLRMRFTTQPESGFASTLLRRIRSCSRKRRGSAMRLPRGQPA